MWIRTNPLIEKRERKRAASIFTRRWMISSKLCAPAVPLQSGARHLEGAVEAFERWQNRMGF
jgi:hypothetical protein